MKLNWCKILGHERRNKKRMALYLCLIGTGFNVMVFIMGIITGRISSIVIGGICAIITAVCTKIIWENCKYKKD